MEQARTAVLAVDHVLLAVQDLDRAATRLRDEHGLDVLDGGPHPGWGTANRLVPLGDSYVELIAVVDPTSDHPFAGAVRAWSAAGDRLMGVCCSTADIDALAERLGTMVLSGERRYPDGQEVTWRLTGVEAALTDQRPFFIQWDGGREVRMGQTAPRHRTTLAGPVRVELGGDVDALHAWLGGPVDGLDLVGGEPGVRRLVVPTADGPLTIA